MRVLACNGTNKISKLETAPIINRILGSDNSSAPVAVIIPTCLYFQSHASENRIHRMKVRLLSKLSVVHRTTRKS
jgi:hypothetical protein